MFVYLSDSKNINQDGITARHIGYKELASLSVYEEFYSLTYQDNLPSEGKFDKVRAVSLRVKFL